jgi:AraC-like DNA-binding protein
VNKLYIWENRVFYLGKLPTMSEHRLGSAALCVGVDGVFSVLESESDAWRECRSVLIPPGCMHEINTHGAFIAVLFLEPESDYYTTLQGLMNEGNCQCLYSLDHENKVIEMLRKIHDNHYDAKMTYAVLDKIITPQSVIESISNFLDVRIDNVIKVIKDDVSQSYSVEALAEGVNLSPTRLVHLFKEQTGVPIRRFRQWNRMKAVIAGAAEGMTLTEAALNAGFSDSAHFSRAFRNMFGIKPSFLLNRSTDLDIIIG